MKAKTKLFNAMFVAMTLSACGSNNDTPTPTPAPVATEVDLSSLTGVWAKRGYGQVIEISNGQTSIYQANSDNCILEDVVDNEIVDQIIGKVILAADETSFNTQPEFNDEDIRPYTYSKLSELQQNCADGGLQVTNDPLTNYEVLWHSFNERFALFNIADRNIDWDAIDVEFRSKLNEVASDEELVKLFIELIKRTGDGHTHLIIDEIGLDVPGGDAPNWFYRVAAFFQENFSLEELQQAFEEQNDIEDFELFVEVMFGQQLGQLIELYNQNKSAYFADIACVANDHICFSINDQNIGYLAIDQMAYYAGDDADTGEDLELLRPLLDEIINGVADTESLIIDIRNNPGGQDVLALEIAGRFTADTQLAFSTKTRYKDTFVNEFDVNVVPTGDSQYTKPIYLLTNNSIYSGGEVFTMTMAEFEHVTVIGESTGGTLSDQNSIGLPNGWTILMSNEIRTDAQGNVYEGVGIPADHEAIYLLPEDVLAGTDTAIEKAFELMAEQQ
jgi:hypothetical protein